MDSSDTAEAATPEQKPFLDAEVDVMLSVYLAAVAELETTSDIATERLIAGGNRTAAENRRHDDALTALEETRRRYWKVARQT